MPEKPTVALPVADLAASLAFYVERLGFAPGERPAPDMAQVIDPDGDALLLVGPRAGDPAPHLAERHFVLAPGAEPLRFPVADLDELRAGLARRGLAGLAAPTETRWGDRVLELRDPDGYRLIFGERAARPPEERLALYARYPDELEAAVRRLAEAALDRAPAPGSWSVRHIVHHLADSETIFVWWMKLALSEPGRTYAQNWPTDNEATAALDHDRRAIAPSLALIRATREHIVQLARHVPDAWERHTLDREGSRVTFGDLVDLLNRHALEHLDEIERIGRADGR